jgi:hypothetical protein
MRTQNRELHNIHSSHTHLSNTMVPQLTTYYNHVMQPHEHRDEYSLATKERNRDRAGGGGINRTTSTHLGHPWEERRHNDVRQPEISTHKLNGGPPYVGERIRDKVAGLFRDKLGVSVSSIG